MNTNSTQNEKECSVIYKIQGDLLDIGYELDQNTSKNPKLVHELQQKLSKHIMICENSQCQISFKARVKVGIQDSLGNYLRSV